MTRRISSEVSVRPGMRGSSGVERGGPRREARAGRADERAAPAGGRLKDAAPFSYHVVWVVSTLMLVLGLSMLLSVSLAGGVTLPDGDKYVYVRQQAVLAAVGLVALYVVSRLNYRSFRKASVLFGPLICLILLLMHIPGVSRSEGGSASWIDLGPVTFQPSEFAKLAVILAGAHYLSLRKSRAGDFKSFMFPFGALGAVTCLLVLLEPDLGTAIIIAGLLLGLLWVGGMRLWQWALVAGVGAAAAVAFTASSSIRTARVTSFLDPSVDPLGAGFQLNQSLVALGRGGWTGVGPGESVQKFSYLPEAHTDMIFAILGEELGLLGTWAVILLFVAFAVACWRLAGRCVDPMGKYLIAGCAMLVTMQAAINMGGVLGAIPLTGVPLPFISYGRNSLLVMLIVVGVILSVARSAPAHRAEPVRKRFGNVTSIDRGRRDGRTRGAGSGSGRRAY